jgi:hypothetical protein
MNSSMANPLAQSQHFLIADSKNDHPALSDPTLSELLFSVLRSVMCPKRPLLIVKDTCHVSRNID